MKKKFISSSFQGWLMIQFYAVSQTCWMNGLVLISSFSTFKMGAVVSVSQRKGRLTPTAHVRLTGGVNYLKALAEELMKFVFVCVMFVCEELIRFVCVDTV